MLLEALYDHHEREGVLEQAAYYLADEDRGVREAAAHLLVLSSSEKAAALTASHISDANIAARNLAGDLLVRMESAAVNAVIPYVDSPDKDTRKFAIDLLAQLPATPEALSRIAARLSDSDPNVVCASIDALGALRARTQLDRLLTLFDVAQYAKPNIVNAVARLSGKQESNFFLRALGDEDPVVQLSAAEALAARKDPSVLEALLQKLESVSGLARPVVLHSIVILLESVDYVGHLSVRLKDNLLEMLDDIDPVYVRTAVRGLKHFAGSDDDVLFALIDHAGKADSIDRAIASVMEEYPDRAAAFALKRTSGERIRPLIRMLTAMIDNLSSNGRAELHPRLLDDVAQCVSRNFPELDVDTKTASLNTFGNLTLPSSVHVVNTALGDPEPAVRSYAIDLTANLGAQNFIHQLETLAHDSDQDICEAAEAVLTSFKHNDKEQD